MLNFAFLLLAALVQDRTPAPDAAAQKQAEKLIRDVFKEEYARKAPVDRIALAKKMIAQAQQTDDDAAARFVLLREARILAQEASDWTTALKAIEETKKQFEVETVSATLAVHSAMAKAAKTPEEMTFAGRTMLALADDALEAQQWDVASRSAAEASALFRQAKNLALVTKAESKVKLVAERQAWSARVVKAAATLEKSPDDPEANYVLGREEGLFKGEWDRAVGLLAKGSDPALKAAASKDADFPDEAPAQVAAGDAWWDLAEKESSDVAKVNLRARAAHWYRKAKETATGLLKEKVAQRLDEVRLDQFRGTWVDVTDPSLFGLQGKPGDAIVLDGTKDGRRATLHKPPRGEFDAISVRVRFDKVPGPLSAIWYDIDKMSVSLFTSIEQGALVTVQPGGAQTVAKRGFILAKEEYAIVVVISRGEAISYIDGEELGRLPARGAAIPNFALQVEKGIGTFDRIRMRRRE
jgi:hypothetical protein